MDKLILTGPDGRQTVFCTEDNRVYLEQLCGVSCAKISANPLLFMAPAELCTANGRFIPGDFALLDAKADSDNVKLTWQVGKAGLRMESLWSVCGKTGVVARKDTLHNSGNDPVTFNRCRSRFILPPAQWEVYAQQCRWSNESQGRWLPLHTGSIRLGCLPGRTTEGGAPYCCLRQLDATEGLAFHVRPVGNWSIEIRARAVQNELAHAVLSLGMADDDLHVSLSAGESLEMMEVLVQSLPGGEPHLAAPALQQYALDKYLTSAKPEVPVVYNTWFDQFEVLEVPRLREQLRAAKEVGCEVFVVDAGWYGPAADFWWSQAGDWRERETAAFFGKMKEFADEVRQAGLGFGLWMEPERYGPDVPVVKANPDWFLPADAEFLRIDLQIPAAYNYLRDEISRLVETYGLVWMKIDFNCRLGIDPTGGELSGYYEGWYRLLDEIRRKHPQTVFEDCASGGLRLELKSLPHFDGHFLTDTVDPIDGLRILQGTLLRIPPGQLTRWNILRSVGRTIPTYTKSVADSPVSLAAPCAAIWEPSKTVDLDFAVAVNLPGILGIGGDLAGLPPEARQRMAQHVAFAKGWRKFMRNATAHLLTPPKPKQDRGGWAAIQLTNASSPASLLLAYRLDDSGEIARFVLRGLDSEKEYRISAHIPENGDQQFHSGADLMQKGLQVDLPLKHRATVLVLEPK